MQRTASAVNCKQFNENQWLHKTKTFFYAHIEICTFRYCYLYRNEYSFNTFPYSLHSNAVFVYLSKRAEAV